MTVDTLTPAQQQALRDQAARCRQMFDMRENPTGWATAAFGHQRRTLAALVRAALLETRYWGGVDQFRLTSAGREAVA